MKYDLKRISWIITILITVIIAGLLFNRFYHDLREWWIMKDKIIWNENTNLAWSDFIYDENKNLTKYNISPEIGISARYRISDKIHYSSKTAFVPEKSFVSDTTDPESLRVANVMFDLCELYRQKLEKHIDSLRTVDLDSIELDYLSKQHIVFTDQFFEDWNKLNQKPKEELSKELKKLETLLAKELNY